MNSLLAVDNWLHDRADEFYGWLGDWFSIRRKTAVRGVCVLYLGSFLYSYFLRPRTDYFLVGFLVALVWVAFVDRDTDSGRLDGMDVLVPVFSLMMVVLNLFVLGTAIAALLLMLISFDVETACGFARSICFLLMVYRGGPDNGGGRKRREALRILAAMLGPKQHTAPAVGLGG